MNGYETDFAITISKLKPADQVLKYFKDATTKGGLAPGDCLLPERDLAEKIGVSRASLRETLRALEILGLTLSVPGQGSYILPPNFRSLSSFFELILSLKPALSENILEFRLTLECEAVKLATKRATPEELAHIKEIIDRMPGTLNRSQLGVDADFEFHKAIMRATHNDLFVFVYEIIETLLKRSHYERRIGVLYVSGVGEKFIDVHRRVYDALMEGDENNAVQRMREHFLEINRLLHKNDCSVKNPQDCHAGPGSWLVMTDLASRNG
ncbi:MAG: FadR/GntR family transcriptional regulator [Desulfatiglandaceae bacterium]